MNSLYKVSAWFLKDRPQVSGAILVRLDKQMTSKKFLFGT